MRSEGAGGNGQRAIWRGRDCIITVLQHREVRGGYVVGRRENGEWRTITLMEGERKKRGWTAHLTSSGGRGFKGGNIMMG